MNLDDACILPVLSVLFVQSCLYDLSEGNRKLVSVRNVRKSARQNIATVPFEKTHDVVNRRRNCAFIE